jgi:hypothetical protein
MDIINRSRLIQIVWFAGLWTVGVATVGTAAYILRWLLQP